MSSLIFLLWSTDSWLMIFDLLPVDAVSGFCLVLSVSGVHSVSHSGTSIFNDVVFPTAATCDVMPMASTTPVFLKEVPVYKAFQQGYNTQMKTFRTAANVYDYVKIRQCK